MGINQANGFKTHNELTMYPLGNYPLAPSVCISEDLRHEYISSFIRRQIRDELISHLAQGGFRFIANISSQFNFASDPGRPAPPFPRTICFTPNNTLIVTFCHQNIAWATQPYTPKAQLHLFLSTGQSRLSLIAVRVYVPHSKQRHTGGKGPNNQWGHAEYIENPVNK